MSFDATFWDYLSPHQKDLVREGSFLYQEVFDNSKYSFNDYSFLIFPFAKAYEGFLKQFLLDCDMIDKSQYNSDHIRLGLLLCPELPYHDERSIYKKIAARKGLKLAESMWLTWKYCRNQVFHYYPHNHKSVTFIEAKERIHMILMTINSCYKALKGNAKSSNLQVDHAEATKLSDPQLSEA